MDTAKQILFKLIDEIPENQIYKIIDFIRYLKVKNGGTNFRELEETSESSMDFWDNDVDDEVWNNAWTGWYITNSNTIYRFDIVHLRKNDFIHQLCKK